MIKPSWTLTDFFGEGVAFNPVPCFEETGWLFPERAACDVLTANQLTFADAAPVICHTSVSTPRVLRMLNDAGLPSAERVERYETRSDYHEVLARLQQEGWRIATTHAQADGVIPADVLWIDASTQRWLNDKGNLDALVPKGGAPQRHRLSAAEFQALIDVEFPVVFKVCSPLTSGAGFGVRVCSNADELRAAQQQLATAPSVVMEEWLDIEKSWCIQFFVAPDGAVHSLGAAEQVTGADGSWHGNWLASPAPALAVDIGAGAARAGAERGYRGPMGLDVALCRDGRLCALDANFRVNGSTALLVYRESLAERGVSVIRSRGWSFDGGFDRMAMVVRAAVDRAHFLPTSAWDPQTGVPRVTGFVLGTSRAEVLGRIGMLEHAGLR